LVLASKRQNQRVTPLRGRVEKLQLPNPLRFADEIFMPNL
jgi:hypothetical protein